VEDKNMNSLKITGLLLAVLLIALPASAHGRFGGRVITVPSFGAWNGYYPYWGLYGVYGPTYPGYPDSHPGSGQLKLSTNVKDADVFINGAFAGKAAKLKSMWLHQDTYNLEVRATGYASFSQRIYVVQGKTMHIDARLAAASQATDPHS
jgi:hypothetical protein